MVQTNNPKCNCLEALTIASLLLLLLLLSIHLLLIHLLLIQSLLVHLLLVHLLLVHLLTLHRLLLLLLLLVHLLSLHGLLLVHLLSVAHRLHRLLLGLRLRLRGHAEVQQASESIGLLGLRRGARDVREEVEVVRGLLLRLLRLLRLRGLRGLGSGLSRGEEVGRGGGLGQGGGGGGEEVRGGGLRGLGSGLRGLLGLLEGRCGVAEVEQRLRLLRHARRLRLRRRRLRGLRLGLRLRLRLGRFGLVIVGEVAEVPQRGQATLPARYSRQEELRGGGRGLRRGYGLRGSGGDRSGRAGHRAADLVAEGRDAALQLAGRGVRGGGGRHDLPGHRNAAQLAALDLVAGTGGRGGGRGLGGAQVVEEALDGRARLGSGLAEHGGLRGGRNGRAAHGLGRGELLLQTTRLLTLDLHRLVVLDPRHNHLDLVTH